MVSHLAQHTPERARNACIRARFYGAYHYGELKSILRKGLEENCAMAEAGAVPEGKAPDAQVVLGPDIARTKC